MKIEFIKSAALMTILLLTYPAVSLAAPSESDKFCSYLDSISAVNVDSRQKNMSDMMAVANHLMDVQDLEIEAINKKLTFPEYKKLVKRKKSIDLPDTYANLYHSRYMKKYCGEVLKTEAEAITRGSKKVHSSNSKIFDKQFDPNDHPLYKKMPPESGRQ
jgi:hypothetical protein